MKFFAESVLKPWLLARRSRHVCEIGASFGENTDKLLAVDGVCVTVIDAFVDANLRERFQNNSRVTVHEGASLDILPSFTERFDCVLIDGDHNWYTVYHELKLIEERTLLTDDGAIFLHDVGWPYGRRDMYYRPELIPPEFLHPYAAKGMVIGQSRLPDAGGCNAEFFNAIEEGGSRNGVLTAVEDFVKERGDAFRLSVIDDEFGLGVLVKSHRASMPVSN